MRDKSALRLTHSNVHSATDTLVWYCAAGLGRRLKRVEVETDVPGTVHIVDDDASFRSAIERRLKIAGYEVVTYTSAQQLLDRIPDESRPGCILLDVEFPT